MARVDVVVIQEDSAPGFDQVNTYGRRGASRREPSGLYRLDRTTCRYNRPIRSTLVGRCSARGRNRLDVSLPIYMDNHATTPVDPRVLEAMLPYLHGELRQRRLPQPRLRLEGRGGGRAGARAGRRADRRQRDKEIVFTSGATESDNLAHQGRGRVLQGQGQPHHHPEDRAQGGARHLQAPGAQRGGLRRAEAAPAHRSSPAATSRPSTSPRCPRSTSSTSDAVPPALGARSSTAGARVTYLDVEKDGRVDPEDVRRGDHRQDDPGLASCSPTTRSAPSSRSPRSASIMPRAAACSSTPTRCRASARSPSTSTTMNVDLASLSAHKMYGPKGVGALYVRRKPRVRIAPHIDGGGHERGMRSGTLNVAGHRRLRQGGRAGRDGDGRARRRACCALRERLRERLDRRSSTRSTLNGSLEHRLPGNLNISFAYVEGEALMMAHQGRRGVVGLGLHLGARSSRPTCCARWASSEDLAHTLDPLRPRPLQHRGRGRLRGRPGGRAR